VIFCHRWIKERKSYLATDEHRWKTKCEFD